MPGAKPCRASSIRREDDGAKKKAQIAETICAELTIHAQIEEEISSSKYASDLNELGERSRPGKIVLRKVSLTCLSPHFASF